MRQSIIHTIKKADLHKARYRVLLDMGVFDKAHAR